MENRIARAETAMQDCIVAKGPQTAEEKACRSRGAKAVQTASLTVFPNSGKQGTVRRKSNGPRGSAPVI